MISGKKRIISLTVKVGILLLAFTFIYNKLSDNNNLIQFNKLVSSVPVEKLYSLLVLVFVLMLLNWFLEALKWRYLVGAIQRISLWQSVESVFCGLTLAIFTPNRIGEYGGRIFFLAPRKRVFGAIAMAVGAIGQMVITNVLGAIAILWFLGTFVQLNVWLFNLIVLLGVLYSGLFILFFFNIHWLDKLLSSIKFLRKFKRYFRVLSRYDRKQLALVFLYCTARFVVFTAQYCIVISLLIPRMELFPMVMMILILFFIQSALPSLDLLDVGVRSMTATYFFSYITEQQIAIMASTACIWLVNLIIPAILGAGFVFKMNFFGTDSN